MYAFADVNMEPWHDISLINLPLCKEGRALDVFRELGVYVVYRCVLVVVGDDISFFFLLKGLLLFSTLIK
jgi:hypothetical protein